MRLRLIAMLGALALATTATAQVLNEELTGEAVLSGEATGTLEDIGRRAAEAGLVLQVNAPDLWEAEILTPVRRGAGDSDLEIRFVNTMSENVVIRGVKPGESEDPLETLKRITNNAKARSIQEEAPAQAVAEPAPTPRSDEPASSRPEIERPSMDMPEVKVERPKAALPQADARVSSRRAREDQTAPPAPTESAPAAPGTPEPAAAASAHPPAGTEQARREEAERFENLYNGGRPIRRSLAPSGLEDGDLVFAGRFHDVVVRRGISTEAFWLEGEWPEDRLEHQEQNRYVVKQPAPDAERVASRAPDLPGEEAERARFERIYNQGREIEATIPPSSLEPQDELYVGESIIVVLRRSKVSIDAFWLGGRVDLDQPAIEHEEKNKYLVVSDIE